MLLPIKLVCDRRARKNGTILYTYSIVCVLMKRAHLKTYGLMMKLLKYFSKNILSRFVVFVIINSTSI